MVPFLRICEKPEKRGKFLKNLNFLLSTNERLLDHGEATMHEDLQQGKSSFSRLGFFCLLYNIEHCRVFIRFQAPRVVGCCSRVSNERQMQTTI